MPAAALCGMVTATFGGMVRDVLCRRPARILHSKADIYASTALAGATAFLALRSAGMPVGVRILGGVGTAVALRYWAWTQGIRLSTYEGYAEKRVAA